MKKFLKILLIIVAVLAVAILVIHALAPEPEYFLTEEECAQRVVGTWEDPEGDYLPLVFNEDGTGLLGELPVTWEIGKRNNAGGGIDNDLFWVECHVDGSDSVFSVTFDYYAHIDFCVAAPYNIYSKDKTKSLGSEKSLYEHVNRPDRVYRYKVGSWEIVTLDESNWNDYFFIGHRDASFEVLGRGQWYYGYNNYVTLKPEYAARIMSLGNSRYRFACSYDYTATPYFATVDEENHAVVLGERNPSVEAVSSQFRFPNEYTYGKECLPYNSVIGVMEFGAELGRIYVPGEYGTEEEGYVYIIEDYELQSASGTLLLAKEVSDR